LIIINNKQNKEKKGKARITIESIKMNKICTASSDFKTSISDKIVIFP
jgi:hypothetical protein